MLNLRQQKDTQWQGIPTRFLRHSIAFSLQTTPLPPARVYILCAILLHCFLTSIYLLSSIHLLTTTSKTNNKEYSENWCEQWAVSSFCGVLRLYNHTRLVKGWGALTSASTVLDMCIIFLPTFHRNKSLSMISGCTWSMWTWSRLNKQARVLGQWYLCGTQDGTFLFP